MDGGVEERGRIYTSGHKRERKREKRAAKDAYLIASPWSFPKIVPITSNPIEGSLVADKYVLASRRINRSRS